MRSLVSVIIVSLNFISGISFAEPSLEGRNLLILDNGISVVKADLSGGCIVEFSLKDIGLNPLNWNFPEKGFSEPQMMGHFICFDRWGQPSDGEEKLGIPYHGEATSVIWTVSSGPVKRKGEVYAEMDCNLPIAGLSMKRKLSLNEKNSVLKVTEVFTNNNKMGRIYNLVQHATLGADFLGDGTFIDTEVKKGFWQKDNLVTPEEPVIYWPKIIFNGKLFDLRELHDDDSPGVVSFVLDDNAEYGWATATNTTKGFLIGYVWKTSEYPWLNMWRNVSKGKPAAYAFEFGTTGFHQPYPVLIQKERIFGRRLFEFIDAGETRSKSYIAFLVKIPSGFKGVSDLTFSNDVITIIDNSEKKRKITFNVN